MTRPSWDFDYAPAKPPRDEPGDAAADLVVATVHAAPASLVARALVDLCAGGLVVETLIDRAPVHWTRVRAPVALSLDEVWKRISAADAEVRYVASSQVSTQALCPPLPTVGPAAAATEWLARTSPIGRDPDGAWHLGVHGLNVNRDRCGMGAGVRLAVIDDDGGKTDELGVDAVVPIGREPPDPRRFMRHGALSVGWAVGSAGSGINGVAPAASARLYCIPKAGKELFTFPLAVVRAVADGADVISCATFLDGTTSPMLDDALAFARHFGRGGRGTPVIVAASREMSSTEGLVRASLSLDLGDPACDPRVSCVAASGRRGGWFLWEDKQGQLQPFSNRGPAVRFMAPGDDVIDALAPSRTAHAESSGATAFSAGVAVLVLANNPRLSASEVETILQLSAVVVSPELDRSRASARRAGEAELLPFETDPDGHNAKHGYGRLDASAACLAARDPIALGLLLLGDREALARWTPPMSTLTADAAAEVCRALLHDPAARHQLAVVLRHLRLMCDPGDGAVDRRTRHTPGALLRMCVLLLEALASNVAAPSGEELTTRAAALRRLTRDPAGRAAFEDALVDAARALWSSPPLRSPACAS
jgi:hypothetical protein